jgi:uncharacterized protein YqeY
MPISRLAHRHKILIGDRRASGPMVKQRHESISSTAGRPPGLVDQEAGEIAVIEAFMPKQPRNRGFGGNRGGDQETGAASMHGKVMAALEKFAGQMDFAKASGMVKLLLK